jgi:hypothetical protein
MNENTISATNWNKSKSQTQPEEVKKNLVDEKIPKPGNTEKFPKDPDEKELLPRGDV